MVTLAQRRDYYDSLNNTTTELLSEHGVFSVPLANIYGVKQVAQSVLESIDETAVADYVLTSQNTEIMAELDEVVEAFFLVKCAERNYKHVESATKYIGGTNLEWHNDGIALRDWATDCWEHCYQVLNEVSAGTRTIPTGEELIAELPVLDWPL